MSAPVELDDDDLLAPRSCCFGPCDASAARGGKGCDLCDRVAKIPQPKRREARDE